MATKWAICGAGNISTDFCSAIRTLPTTEHQIVAVAARDAQRAAKFAEKFDIQSSFDSYDELAKLDNVDIIYIGVIHIGHVELSLKFIEAGKNVLCEKPMALSVEGATKVLQAAKDKGVFFMEGYWTRCFPVYNYLREQVSSGVIGDLKQIEISFCVNFHEFRPLMKRELGDGSLTDFGCYTLLIANTFFKGKPEAIQSMMNLKGEDKIDKTGLIHLRYSDDRFATLSFCGELGFANNYAVFRGTKGNFVIPEDVWSPDHVILPTGEKKAFPLPPEPEKNLFRLKNSIGFVYEIQCVRECLQKGLTECPVMKHEDSLAVTEIMCEVLSSHGAQYNSL